MFFAAMSHVGSSIFLMVLGTTLTFIRADDPKQCTAPAEASDEPVSLVQTRLKVKKSQEEKESDKSSGEKQEASTERGTCQRRVCQRCMEDRMKETSWKDVGDHKFSQTIPAWVAKIKQHAWQYQGEDTTGKQDAYPTLWTNRLPGSEQHVCYHDSNTCLVSSGDGTPNQDPNTKDCRETYLGWLLRSDPPVDDQDKPLKTAWKIKYECTRKYERALFGRDFNNMAEVCASCECTCLSQKMPKPGELVDLGRLPWGPVLNDKGQPDEAKCWYYRVRGVNGEGLPQEPVHLDGNDYWRDVEWAPVEAGQHVKALKSQYFSDVNAAVDKCAKQCTAALARYDAWANSPAALEKHNQEQKQKCSVSDYGKMYYRQFHYCEGGEYHCPGTNFTGPDWANQRRKNLLKRFPSEWVPACKEIGSIKRNVRGTPKSSNHHNTGQASQRWTCKGYIRVHEADQYVDKQCQATPNGFASPEFAWLAPQWLLDARKSGIAFLNVRNLDEYLKTGQLSSDENPDKDNIFGGPGLG